MLAEVVKLAELLGRDGPSVSGYGLSEVREVDVPRRGLRHSRASVNNDRGGVCDRVKPALIMIEAWSVTQ